MNTSMRHVIARAGLCLALGLGLFAQGPIMGAALAQEAIVATVNDHPITGFDVDQRVQLLKFMGEARPEKLTRKAAFNSIVDDYIKIDEAKLYKLNPSDKDVDDRLRDIAKNLKTDDAGLKAKLANVGLTITALRSLTAAQMSMRQLIQIKYHDSVKVDPADVDKKMAEIKADLDGKVAKIENDPNRQPIRVLQLQEINFPVDGTDPQLFQSRAIEASQVVQKLTSCSGIKAASTGIFNVQLGKMLQADARKLPPQMQQIINKTGIGHAIGPMRYAKGVQLLALCGTRVITPPKLQVTMPTRDQIQNMTFDQKYQAIEDKYVSQMRKTAIIEYKDQSYAQ